MAIIAVLITCHNRKEITLACLNSLFEAKDFYIGDLELFVYLTDDGSTDGTANAVRISFSNRNVEILEGNGNMFWAGGMRNSWKEALKYNYDGYLLLNDDTLLNENVFVELIKANNYSVKSFNKSGIYIGATNNFKNDKVTYSAWKIKNRYLNTLLQIYPNGEYQLCELGNANIMYVSKNVVDRIGILHNKFIHGIADFDYTLQARKNNFPVILLPKTLGKCDLNNANKNQLFSSLSIKKRWKYLNSPIGFGFHDQLIYMKRNFPIRLPFVFFIGILKVLFPSLYHRINSIRFKI